MNGNRPSEPRRSLAEIVEEAGVEIQDQFGGPRFERGKTRIQFDQIAYLLTQLARFGRYLKDRFSSPKHRPN